MTEKVTEDRGDALVLTGDEAGDTADLKAKEAEVAAAKEVADKATADKEAADKAASEKEATDKAAADGKKISIPKERFDEAVGKARAEAAAAQKALAEAQGKLKQMEGQIDAGKVELEIDKLEDELDKARADGKAEEVARLRKEIRGKMQALSHAQARAEAVYATAVAVETVKYDAAVTRMEVEHPELNPESDTYDEARVAEVQEFKDAFEAAGKSSTEALQKALKAVYRGGDKPAADDKAKEKAAAETKARAEAEAAKRKEEAVKRGLDAKAKQPADTKGGGDSDKNGKSDDPAANAAKLSDREFDKLTEDELKKARGDSL